MLISKFVSKVIGEKARWRQYKARVRQLPENYRTAVEAVWNHDSSAARTASAKLAGENGFSR